MTDVNQQFLDLAIQLTTDLHMENPPVQNQGKKIGQPHSSNYYLFYWEFKTALGDNWPKLDVIKASAFVSLYWNAIGQQRRDIWTRAQKKSLELYKSAGGVIGKTPKHKKKMKMTVYFCRYCNLSSKNFKFRTCHFEPVHYPECKSDELEALLFTDLNNLRSEAYAQDFHNECVNFFARLHTEPSIFSYSERQEIEKYQKMFSDLMEGDQTSTIYLATQFPDNFEELEDVDKPKETFRYCGQFTTQLRHLLVSKNHQAGQGTIGKEITKLITKRLTQFKPDGSDVPTNMKLYFWYALKTPAKSTDAIEQAVIMAMRHISGYSSSFWNQRNAGIREGSALRTANPADIVYLGLYIVRQLVLELKEELASETFFTAEKSTELFETYDNFTQKQLDDFNDAYRIQSETVPLLTHIDLINRIEKLAQEQKNDDLFELANMFRFGLQVDSGDEEMDIE